MRGKLHETGDYIADRYEVVHFVGEGGMQEVYRAKDHVLDKEVALKAPKNTSAEKRFKGSAVVSARVNHPHVAKTLDYVDTDSGPYLIEEFIEGCDLQKVLEQDFLTIDPYLAARIFHHLAKGLAASHHVGVIHRDLKPSNVMSSGKFNLSEVKITDFGIAKMAEEELSNARLGGEASMIASLTMVGALPYMSPEMIKDPHTPITSADVWSLGAMMYELLSGHKPFGVGLVVAHKVLSGEVPSKPQYIDSNTQFKSLGNELYDLILECLNRNPEDRPSADALVMICGKLCYPISERKVGVVREIRYGTQGFIENESGLDVFFHFDSVYGLKPKVGSRVCFSEFPGEPAPRAHPVVMMR
jgi:serine/threonine-protein kinase